MISSPAPWGSVACTCPDEMPDARACARCGNGGAPLPPYRLPSGIEDDGLDVGGPGSWQVLVHTTSSGVTTGTAALGFACVCGEDLSTGEEVYRTEADTSWRGVRCCGGVEAKSATSL